jgi:hypothetical protein
MKNLLTFISIIYLFINVNMSFAQIQDLEGNYASSVAPNKSITYSFTPRSISTDGCTFTWVPTNAQVYANNVPFTTTVSIFTCKWENMNANASLEVSLSNCNNSASNSTTGSYSVPIRYLGDIGAISLNGSTSNPQSVNCGVQSVTLSVGAATNATNYEWDLSNLTGWSINSGQGTNTITATTSAGASGVINVAAKRNDAPDVSSVSNASVTRPSILSNVSITGNSQGCYNQSGTYSLSNYNSITSTTWSISSPLSIVSSSISSALVNYGGNDSYGTLTAQLTDGCNNTASRSFPIGVGSPNISTINWNGNANNGPVPAPSGSTNYLNASSSNSPSANYSLNVANNYGNISTSLYGVNGGNAQVYVYGTQGNSTISINASNVCGSKSSSLTVYIPYSYGYGYMASPNPAQESLAVTFTDTQSQDALPDQIDIVSEKTSKSVRSINIKDAIKNHGLKDGNKAVFDIKDLPRGTYYLKIINPRQEKDKKIETVRVLFE